MPTMDSQRSHPTSFRGVTFWPRPAARNAPTDRDVLCENCGYNLRGLPAGINTCPECGTKFDPVALRTKAADQQRSQLPWKQRKAVGFFEGYYGSTRMVLLHPQRFAAEIWHGGRLGRRESNAFRWITIAHAYMPLLAIAIATLGPLAKSTAQFVPLALVGGLTLLFWLHRTTNLLVGFFRRQIMSADVQARVIGLASFTSAPLALSPIHLLMFALAGMARRVEGTAQPGMLFTALALTWGAFTTLQLLWWWFTTLQIVRASMRCNEAELIAVALTFLGLWALQTAFYLGLVPFIAYQVVVNVLGIG